ncbi:hypothetical protein [Aeromicrobium marinum]|nr:hypothetical protein [Aeromicrobium marinum]
MFKPGERVITPRSQGIVIDVAPTPSGQFVFGVEDESGEVTYFTSKALRGAES